MDEATADDGALHRFFAFWVRYRLRQDAPRSLDEPGAFERVLAAYEADGAP